MNVLFHTATAVATIVFVATVAPQTSLASYIKSGLLSLALGVIFHGVLDYIPHCYPINSKVDVSASLLIMAGCVWKAARKYKPIVVLSFIGNVLPDIVDLLPAILNKYLNLNITVAAKMFPWHWPLYSGSIYSGSCTISNLNHFMIIALICVICWSGKKHFKEIFL